MRAVTRVALSAVVLFAACDSPTDTDDGVIYDLSQTATQTLPIELGEVQAGCVDTLYAGSVVLEDDNDAVSYTGVIRNCGGPRTQMIKTRAGSYTQTGNQLSFTWELDNDLIIAYVTELAVLESNTLTFRARVFSEEDPDGTTFYDYAIYRRR